jgi:hypothetical protein
MFQNFSPRALQVLQLANREADRWNHEYLGTEHLLLGLIEEPTGHAGHILKTLGVEPDFVRREVNRLVQPSQFQAVVTSRPHTPRTNKVIEYSADEARDLEVAQIDTEHLLLGLLRETEGVGGQVLFDLGVTYQRARVEILKLPKAPAIDLHAEAIRAAGTGSMSAPIASPPPPSPPIQLTKPVNILADSTNERGRWLEIQLRTVRVALGAILGVVAGALLESPEAALLGLFLGMFVSFVAVRVLAATVGGAVGVLIALQFASERPQTVFIAPLASIILLLLVCEIGRPIAFDTSAARRRKEFSQAFDD